MASLVPTKIDQIQGPDPRSAALVINALKESGNSNIASGLAELVGKANSAYLSQQASEVKDAVTKDMEQGKSLDSILNSLSNSGYSARDFENADVQGLAQKIRSSQEIVNAANRDQQRINEMVRKTRLAEEKALIEGKAKYLLANSGVNASEEIFKQLNKEFGHNPYTQNILMNVLSSENMGNISDTSGENPITADFIADSGLAKALRNQKTSLNGALENFKERGVISTDAEGNAKSLDFNSRTNEFIKQGGFKGYVAGNVRKELADAYDALRSEGYTDEQAANAVFNSTSGTWLGDFIGDPISVDMGKAWGLVKKMTPSTWASEKQAAFNTNELVKLIKDADTAAIKARSDYEKEFNKITNSALSSTQKEQALIRLNTSYNKTIAPLQNILSRAIQITGNK